MTLDDSWIRKRGEELLQASTKEERQQIIVAIVHSVLADLAFLEGEEEPLGVIDENLPIVDL